MEIKNSKKEAAINNIVMIVYGPGGVGKTTFAATAPKPVIIDFEGGSKFLGSRGFDVDIIKMKKWFTNEEKKKLLHLIKNYETIVLDPLGEAMEILMESEEVSGKKYRTYDGSLTMPGWGEVKKRMIGFIRTLRATGKNIIIVAHDSEEKDGETVIHRIQVATKLKEKIPTMVDIISYMGIKKEGDKTKRILYTPRQTTVFDSKDRTDKLPVQIDISEKNGFADFKKFFLPTEPYQEKTIVADRVANKIAEKGPVIMPVSEEEKGDKF